MAGRVKEGLLRLGDISLVAMAAGCGYVGYSWIASEDAAAKQQRVRRQRSAAERRHIEKAFFELARQYDLKVDELTKQRDQLYKLRDEVRNLSNTVLKENKEVGIHVENLKKSMEEKQELQRSVSSLQEQKRAIDAEVKELSKLVKIKEDLKARSKDTSSVAPTAEYELQILSTKVQERSRALEAEIEELMRLVKVKEELQAKSEALDKPILTHLGDPMLKKDDPVQS